MLNPTNKGNKRLPGNITIKEIIKGTIIPRLIIQGLSTKDQIHHIESNITDKVHRQEECTKITGKTEPGNNHHIGHNINKIIEDQILQENKEVPTMIKIREHIHQVKIIARIHQDQIIGRIRQDQNTGQTHQEETTILIHQGHIITLGTTIGQIHQARLINKDQKTDLTKSFWESIVTPIILKLKECSVPNVTHLDATKSHIAKIIINGLQKHVLHVETGSIPLMNVSETDNPHPDGIHQLHPEICTEKTKMAARPNSRRSRKNRAKAKTYTSQQRVHYKKAVANITRTTRRCLSLRRRHLKCIHDEIP